MSTTKSRIKQILNDCCAGNASLATDILHEQFVIIDRSELPMAFKDDTGCVAVDGVEHSVWPLTRTTASRARRDALDYLAAAELIEASLPTRRDELAAEFTAVDSYAGQLPYTQKLIDRIIELENKA